MKNALSIVAATTPFLSVGFSGIDSALADVIRVPQEYPTIQDGLNAAGAGDTVLVADGVYTGQGNKGLFNPGVPLTLRSENGPANCVIDCEGSGVAFWMVAAEPPDYVIQGFTVTRAEGSTGGAFFIHHRCEATIRECVITRCTASMGGAVHCETDSLPTFINCTFSENSAVFGGALSISDGSSPDFINCLVSGNTASQTGGGVWFGTFGTSPRLINCTITGNEAAGAGSGVLVRSGLPSISNSIVWDNLGSEISDEAGVLTVRYSDVKGGFQGEGNINADPMFIDPDAGDYRLSPGSACIDSADNDAVPPGVITDLAGNPRFIDDPDTPDTGNGKPPIVDMGAFEFPASSAAELLRFEIVTGALLDGELSDLEQSDDLAVHTRSGFGQSLIDLHKMDMVISAETTVQSPSTLDVTIESRIDEPAGQMHVRLKNWNTNQFVHVGSFPLNMTDTPRTLSDINAANYVNAAGEIEVMVRHLVFVPIFAFTFESWIDHVRIEVD